MTSEDAPVEELDPDDATLPPAQRRALADLVERLEAARLEELRRSVSAPPLTPRRPEAMSPVRPRPVAPHDPRGARLLAIKAAHARYLARERARLAEEVGEQEAEEGLFAELELPA